MSSLGSRDVFGKFPIIDDLSFNRDIDVNHLKKRGESALSLSLVKMLAWFFDRCNLKI